MHVLTAMRMYLCRCCLPLLPVFFLISGAASGQYGGTADEDEVRSVILLARHGVRAPIESEIRASAYNAQPWPSWPVGPGVLTSHGTEALYLLGDYYRLRYAGLLQHPSCDDPVIYVEANTSQRTIASAHALVKRLVPECEVEVHSRPQGTGTGNPLFTPAASELIDRERMAAAINGKMAGHADWFTHAFTGPLTEMHRVLMDCSGKDCDTQKLDLRDFTAKVQAASGRGLVTVESPVSLGADFTENFLLQYTEGLPMEKVGWGRVSRSDLDQLMEMNTRFHDFVLRTPYSAQAGASELAQRIRATIDGAASGKTVSGALGTPQDRFILLVGHDSNLAWLGGLLRLDWLLPDQTFNATPPGSALVFELHRNRVSGANSVQVFFISQTLDQMRNLRPLKGDEQSSVAPVFMPGCSGPAPDYACTLDDFNKVVISAMDKRLAVSAAN